MSEDSVSEKEVAYVPRILVEEKPKWYKGADSESRWRYDHLGVADSVAGFASIAERIFYKNSRERIRRQTLTKQGQVPDEFLGVGRDEDDIRYDTAKSTFIEIMSGRKWPWVLETTQERCLLPDQKAVEAEITQITTRLKDQEIELSGKGRYLPIVLHSFPQLQGEAKPASFLSDLLRFTIEKVEQELDYTKGSTHYLSPTAVLRNVLSPLIEDSLSTFREKYVTHLEGEKRKKEEAKLEEKSQLGRRVMGSIDHLVRVERGQDFRGVLGEVFQNLDREFKLLGEEETLGNRRYSGLRTTILPEHKEAIGRKLDELRKANPHLWREFTTLFFGDASLWGEFPISIETDKIPPEFRDMRIGDDNYLALGGAKLNSLDLSSQDMETEGPTLFAVRERDGAPVAIKLWVLKPNSFLSSIFKTLDSLVSKYRWQKKEMVTLAPEEILDDGLSKGPAVTAYLTHRFGSQSHFIGSHGCGIAQTIWRGSERRVEFREFDEKHLKYKSEHPFNSSYIGTLGSSKYIMPYVVMDFAQGIDLGGIPLAHELINEVERSVGFFLLDAEVKVSTAEGGFGLPHELKRKEVRDWMVIDLGLSEPISPQDRKELAEFTIQYLDLEGLMEKKVRVSAEERTRTSKGFPTGS